MYRFFYFFEYLKEEFIYRTQLLIINTGHDGGIKV